MGHVGSQCGQVDLLNQGQLRKFRPGEMILHQAVAPSTTPPACSLTARNKTMMIIHSFASVACPLLAQAKLPSALPGQLLVSCGPVRPIGSNVTFLGFVYLTGYQHDDPRQSPKNQKPGHILPY